MPCRSMPAPAGKAGPTDAVHRQSLIDSVAIRLWKKAGDLLLIVALGDSIEEFADVETHLAGLIEVRIMDEPAIERALEATTELPDFPYPAGYAERLRAAQLDLLKLGRVLMEVAVTAEGGDCEVKAEPPL